MKHKTLIADILLLLVALVWGATFVLVKNVIEILPPFSFNAFRFIIAAIFLLIIILVFYRNVLAQINRKQILIGGFVGIFLFAGYAFQTIGLLTTTASKAGFITGMSVVIVPLIAIIFLKEALRRQAAIGISLAILGLFLLSISSDWSIAFGDFLIFLCAISYALHIIFVGKWAPGYHALGLAFIQITTVAILNTISAILFEDLVNLDVQAILVPTVLWGIFICSIFATALAFLIQTAAQKFTSPTKTAIILATEPVFAAIAGYLFANELLAMREWLGCMMILLGMIIAEWPSPSERKARKLTKELNAS